jgi:hypothetical protein
MNDCYENSAWWGTDLLRVSSLLSKIGGGPGKKKLDKNEIFDYSYGNH